ncbi:hypothetical protein [Chryseobacterium lathyri]|uniref:Uncharacterized protein n=1 Tax=Chryseobacterium lathyri TaxID=395933 RepID=A0A511YCQ4_9FLAO|nr:hypothetical protein [Chryseobacterium lathyri]GEN72974.1 hypothetical protein CLA01_30460 [Chryseobacterium lathyri]
MKTRLLLLASILFLSVNAHSQVGINTPTPSSTLDVKGSVEGNFREITGTSTLDILDYHVSFSGASDATLNLPAKSTTDGTPADFRGRKYYIKNNSTTNNLTLVAAAGQIIRSGGMAAANNTFMMQPGKYAVLTASGANGWDLDVVVSSVAANNWELASMDNQGPVIAFQAISTSGYTTLSGSAVTVIVPAGYTQRKVVLNFTGFGEGSGTTNAQGTLRFQIVQTGTATATYGSVNMMSWVSLSGAIRSFNHSTSYSISGLNPGTYTFNLQVSREGEIGVGAVTNWGTVGRADVYVK